MEAVELTTARPLARDADVERFLALVERHSGHMYRLAFRLVGNEQDARDVVQESLLRAYSHLHAFEERAELGTWLHRIVANCALDLLRARRSRPDHARPAPIASLGDSLASSSPDPERLAASAETARDVATALDTLKPIERATFVLRHFEGRSIDEIARTLGLGQSAAKQHVFRAIRKLRLILCAHRSGQ